MSDPGSVMSRLDELASELDGLSRDLAKVERQLVPVEAEYEEFMAAFSTGLWERHVADGEKFPPERIREQLAHRAMAADLLGRYTGLVAQRRRMKDRISSLKATVDAQRSILSALKEEMSATSELAPRGVRGAA